MDSLQCLHWIGKYLVRLHKLRHVNLLIEQLAFHGNLIILQLLARIKLKLILVDGLQSIITVVKNM